MLMGTGRCQNWDFARTVSTVPGGSSRHQNLEICLAVGDGGRLVSPLPQDRGVEELSRLRVCPCWVRLTLSQKLWSFTRRIEPERRKKVSQVGRSLMWTKGKLNTRPHRKKGNGPLALGLGTRWLEFIPISRLARLQCLTIVRTQRSPFSCLPPTPLQSLLTNSSPPTPPPQNYPFKVSTASLLTASFSLFL